MTRTREPIEIIAASASASPGATSSENDGSEQCQYVTNTTKSKTMLTPKCNTSCYRKIDLNVFSFVVLRSQLLKQVPLRCADIGPALWHDWDDKSITEVKPCLHDKQRAAAVMFHLRSYPKLPPHARQRGIWHRPSWNLSFVPFRRLSWLPSSNLYPLVKVSQWTYKRRPLVRAIFSASNCAPLATNIRAFCSNVTIYVITLSTITVTSAKSHVCRFLNDYA